MKKDNSTLDYKVMLRRELLQQMGIDNHCILETHGGTGQLYRHCYPNVENGMVFETDKTKSGIISKQRQTWRVYHSDCIVSLQNGVGNDLQFTILDADPYGNPWEVIKAFFGSSRKFAPIMGVAVNDGMRQKLSMGAWDVKAMARIVEKYGNKIHDKYLEICRELLETHSAIAGYEVDYFSGYYTGHIQQMTHYMAILKQG